MQSKDRERIRAERDRIEFGAGESALTFHGKPIEWAHDPNSCGVCKAYVEGHDETCPDCETRYNPDELREVER